MPPINDAELSHALRAAQEPQAAPAARSALALGCAGALGEELLSLLVGSGQYRQVHVGVTQPIGSATARFAPWVVGQGTPLVDDAWICLTGAETFVPKASPVRRFAADELLAAARLARDAGARRLAVVAPLAALLQMGASASHIGSADEMELTRFGFERLVIVRPTAAGAAGAQHGPHTRPDHAAAARAAVVAAQCGARHLGGRAGRWRRYERARCARAARALGGPVAAPGTAAPLAALSVSAPGALRRHRAVGPLEFAGVAVAAARGWAQSPTVRPHRLARTDVRVAPTHP
jgi:hypothetical protein